MGAILMLVTVAILILIASAVKITREYERGVIFRLGRLSGVKGPGLFLIIPLIDRMKRVDLRVVTLDIPSQEVITKDNVSVKLDAVLYFKIADPIKATIEIEDYVLGTSTIAQTSVRSIVGSHTLDEVLSERDKANLLLHAIIDEATDPWGIKVTMVEIKRVILPKEMERAIGRQAEAERMKRAKIILAEGEYQAATKLKEAGVLLGAKPLTLRYLQTIAEAAKEPNTTIIFPAEMLELFQKKEG